MLHFVFKKLPRLWRFQNDGKKTKYQRFSKIPSYKTIMDPINPVNNQIFRTFTINEPLYLLD